MAIDPFIPGANSARNNGALFVKMRAQLEDLQRQIGTGKKAETFADLGLDRRTSLDTRSKMATIEGWNKSIEQGDLRIRFMMQNIEGFAKNASDSKGFARSGTYSLNTNGQLSGQVLATDRLSQSIDMLNVDVGGRYLFSGRSHDVKPVEAFSVIMKAVGSSGPAGVKTLISERQQADAGVGNLGRLTNTLAGTTVTVAREASDPPYGYTIASTSSTSPNIAAALAAGPPASASFNVATNPTAGDKVTLTLSLPDSTTVDITLEARQASAPGAAETGFVIGASAAATAANLQASVTAALQKQTATSLGVASAMIASRDFFAGSSTNPPLRVPGPSFATATAPPAPGAAGATVIWYKGDDSAAVQARNTANVQVDESQTVAAGARANEQAFREGLTSLVVFATTIFSTADPNSAARYEAMADRVGTGLSFNNVQSPEHIAVEISAAQSAMKSATERHKISTNFLESARASVEDPNDSEVAAALLSMQTRMQASYQTTSILAKLTLTDYLR